MLRRSNDSSRTSSNTNSNNKTNNNNNNNNNDKQQWRPSTINTNNPNNDKSNNVFTPSSVPTSSPLSKNFQSSGYPPSPPSSNFLSSPLPSNSSQDPNNSNKNITNDFNFNNSHFDDNTNDSTKEHSINQLKHVHNNNISSSPNFSTNIRSSNIEIRSPQRLSMNASDGAHSLPVGNGELMRFHSMPNFKPKFNPVTFSTKMVISGRPIEAHQEVNCSSFHLSGEILATGGSDHSVKLWDTSNLGGVPVYKKQLGGPTSSVLNVQFSPHANVLSGTSNDRNVYIWEPSGKEMHILTGHTEKVTCVTYLDEKTLGSVSWDRYLRFFDLNTGFSTGSYHLGSRMNSACVGPFSCTIVTGHIDKKLRVFDYRNGRMLHSIDAHARDITSVVSCPDIPYLVLTSSKDNTLKISDLRTLEVVTTFKHAEYKNPRDINLVCFSPNGKFVVAGGEEGKIFFWNRLKGGLENLITTSTNKNSKSCVSCVSWNPKRNQLIACLDNALYLYDGESVQ